MEYIPTGQSMIGEGYMVIKFQIKNQILIAAMEGEIDHHSAGEIKEKIERMFTESGCNRVVFDFTGVDFMDSSGIGMVIGRYKHVKALGGGLAIAGANDTIDRIFTISGLYKIIQKYPTVAEACSHL